MSSSNRAVRGALALRAIAPILLIAMILSWAMENAGAHLSDKTKQLKLDSNRAHSAAIIECLRTDLKSLDSLKLGGNANWNSTLKYCLSKLEDSSFDYICTIRRFAIDGYTIDLEWMSNLVEETFQLWPSVQVFLPSNQFRQATLASFRGYADPSFLQLPAELTDFFKSNMVSHIGEIWSIRIQGDSLHSLFPMYSRKESVLYSQEASRKNTFEST